MPLSVSPLEIRSYLRHRAPCSAREISEELNVPASALRVTLQELVQRGEVQVIPSSKGPHRYAEPPVTDPRLVRRDLIPALLACLERSPATLSALTHELGGTREEVRATLESLRDQQQVTVVTIGFSVVARLR